MFKNAVLETSAEGVVGLDDVTGDVSVVFEPAPHRYTGYFPDGSVRVLPSVTQILEGVGLIDTRWYPAEATFRGTMVHSVAAWIDRGFVQLDFFKGDSYFGWYEAWEQFKLMNRFRAFGVERTVIGWCPSGCWAGKVDRDGVFDEEIVRERYDLPEDAIVLLDLKSGGYEKWHKLQLEGYRQSYPERLRSRIHIFGVYLKKTGLFDVRYCDEDLSEEWFDCVRRYYEKVGGAQCVN